MQAQQHREMESEEVLRHNQTFVLTNSKSKKKDKTNNKVILEEIS